ncbi:MAG: GTPase Era, partial [Bacteroidota bacterium]
MQEVPHKAGFVNIIGKPNVGKSTLMNTLVGEKLSIITAKAQTTRHRIAGIVNGDHFQLIYSDTPGFLVPRYALQQSMKRAVNSALVDADVLLWVVDIRDRTPLEPLATQLQQHPAPVLLLINKVDLVEEAVVQEAIQYWTKCVAVQDMLPISALQHYNTSQVFERILAHLPVHPPYYPKDTLTDRPERFFAAEIIREQILQHYHEEVPYSVEVIIEAFHEEGNLLRISAVINVDKQSQKGILIGRQGNALKQMGTAARQALEQFFAKR